MAQGHETGATAPVDAPSRVRRPAGIPDRSTERAHIIEVAYRVLDESEGASVPITDVLAAAGMSTRAFYRHFDSKDALLLEMFRSDSTRVLDELRAAADRADTAREALHSWILGMLRLAADPRRRRRTLVLTSDEVTRAKGFRLERERYRAGQDAAVADLLRRGLLDGSMPASDPDRDAPLVRAVFSEGFEMVMTRPVGLDVDPVATGVLAFVDRALGVRPRGA
jgi:AcrR family transcriptional regulator